MKGGAFARGNGFYLLTKPTCRDTYIKYAIQEQGAEPMPLSLRIPSKKEEMIRKAAVKAGKTKSAYIIDAVDEKLGLVKNREKAAEVYLSFKSRNH